MTRGLFDYVREWNGSDVKHGVFQSVAKLAACEWRNLPGEIPLMHTLGPRREIGIEDFSTRVEAGNILV